MTTMRIRGELSIGDGNIYIDGTDLASILLAALTAIEEPGPDAFRYQGATIDVLVEANPAKSG